MDYGVCILSVVPCRAEPNDRSEMVSQLLFGELVTVLQKNEKWLKVQIESDGYKCWVDRKQIHEIGQSVFKKLLKEKVGFSHEILSPVQNNVTKEYIPIVMGSTIRGLEKDGNFTISDFSFHIDAEVISPSKKVERSKLVEHAFSYLNAPYLWGGKSILGIDCSGFTQLVYAMSGVSLPRDSDQQSELGHGLSFIEEAEEGDLAFFDNNEGKIVHVGIMLSDHRIIHASGQVRIDRIDHQGIYRNDIKDYSHSLRIIKKII